MGRHPELDGPVLVGASVVFPDRRRGAHDPAIGALDHLPHIAPGSIEETSIDEHHQICVALQLGVGRIQNRHLAVGRKQLGRLRDPHLTGAESGSGRHHHHHHHSDRHQQTTFRHLILLPNGAEVGRQRRRRRFPRNG